MQSWVLLCLQNDKALQAEKRAGSTLQHHPGPVHVNICKPHRSKCSPKPNQWRIIMNPCPPCAATK